MASKILSNYTSRNLYRRELESPFFTILPSEIETTGQPNKRSNWKAATNVTNDQKQLSKSYNVKL